VPVASTEMRCNCQGSHPIEYLLIAMPGCRKALVSQNMVTFVDNCPDMKILMSVDATDHVTNDCILTNFHRGFPGSTLTGRPCRDRMPGQDSNVTGCQALLGSHASARPSLTGRWLGRLTDPGKDTEPGRSTFGSGGPDHLAVSAILEQFVAQYEPTAEKLPTPSFLLSVLKISSRPNRRRNSLLLACQPGRAAEAERRDP
jgi:hypothetical protein